MHVHAHALDSCDVSAATIELDRACRRFDVLKNGGPVAESAAFHRTISLIHGICDALVACETAGVPSAELRHLVAAARQVHAASPFIERLQTWPRGYPGDFETIEWLCRGDNRAGSLIGKAFERYALTSSIAQPHRNKVPLQAAAKHQAMHGRGARILSLACGSSPDLRSILPHVPDDAAFALCDSDPGALDFSAAHLRPIADRCTFIRGLVPRVLRRAAAAGPFDLIVAGGLFDYLPDRAIARTLAECWTKLLVPNGRVMFTNIVRGNPFRVWLEYLANWTLIERSEDDVRRLCVDAGIVAPPDITTDSTGLALLVSVRREPTIRDGGSEIAVSK